MPLNWNSPDTSDNTPEAWRGKPNWSSIPSPRPWKWSPEPSATMLGWIQLMFWTNWDRNTLWMLVRKKIDLWLKFSLWTIVEEGKYFGVDINSVSGICNTYNAFIWEPIVVKQNALSAACEVKKKYLKSLKTFFWRLLAQFCLLMRLLETRNRNKMRNWSKMFNREEEDHPWWAEVDWDPTWRWDKIKEKLEII